MTNFGNPNNELQLDLEDDAITESLSDVIMVCDRSHMTPQERCEFLMNLDYSANQSPEAESKTIQKKDVSG
jgi:hypothetical protein